MPGWITLFKVIPWMDLAAAAPGIARGAKKLWTEARERQSGAVAGVPVSVGGRLEALEAQVAELTKELNVSSEVIKSMTEQNARLVEAVGILRLRTQALLVACGVLIVFSLALGYTVWIA